MRWFEVVAIELIVTCSSALSGSVIVVLALVFVIAQSVSLREQQHVAKLQFVITTNVITIWAFCCIPLYCHPRTSLVRLAYTLYNSVPRLTRCFSEIGRYQKHGGINHGAEHASGSYHAIQSLLNYTLDQYVHCMDTWSCCCSYWTTWWVCHILVMWSKLCLANKLEASASMSQRLVLTSTLALQTRQRCVSCSQMLCASYISRNALNVHVTHVSTGKSYRADRPTIGLCCSIMI